MKNEIQYTGGIYDKDTKEYYLNARYYDPSGGRFLTQDTYRGEQTNRGTWNLYSYCAGNPINRVDPSGHWAEPIHKEMTEQAVKKSNLKLTSSQLKYLKDGSALPDIKWPTRENGTDTKQKLKKMYLWKGNLKHTET